MSAIKTLSTISKKEIVALCKMNEQQAKDFMKFRTKLPVLLDEDGSGTVDARTLHTQLKSETNFTTWIKRRIEQNMMEEGTDYWIHRFPKTDSGYSATKGGGHNAINYTVTTDSAKMIAMMEKNEIGLAARRYFVLAEKIANQMLVHNELRATCISNNKMFNKFLFEIHGITHTGHRNQFQKAVSDFNKIVSKLATNHLPKQWEEMGLRSPRNYLKPVHLDYYFRIQDAVLRMYIAGDTPKEILERGIAMYRPSVVGQQIFDETVARLTNKLAA